MHGWIDSEISAILFALIVIVIVSLAFAHHVILKSNRRSKKSHKFETSFGALVEREEQVGVYYRSMLVTHSNCVICQNPTTRRCSRCKLTKYCSSECQVVHWRESHKNECRMPKEKSFESEVYKNESMCNGKQLKTSKNVDSSVVLNPISLGFFKSSNKKIKKEKEQLSSHFVNAPTNAPSLVRSFPRPKTLLFPYKYFIKLFEWEGLNEPCGLINCGNSCFANVVLQCLTYTQPLTAYLLDGCHGEDCRRNDWCFMCELQNHVYKVRHSQNPFSPLRILSRIRFISNNLGYGRQEDAHEFMRFAIDSMQSICLDEVGGEKMIDLPTQETTLIHHIFGGHLQSQVKCMQCKHESNRYESMMDLAVEIHGLVESLEDAIAQFTAIEILDGDNKYKCDICNAYVKAQKQLTLHEAPNILTIALKRFQSGKFGKLNKRITFPEVLDMSPYMSEKQLKLLLYKLYAVVVHVDMLNASFFGHYICYVKDSYGLWYKIDDNKVKEVELEKVLVQRAYMLFYSRSEVRREPLTEGFPSTILASCLASKLMNNSSTKSQRGSTFLPSIITPSLSSNFSTDNFNVKKPSLFNLSNEEKNSYQKDSQNSKKIVDKDVQNIYIEEEMKAQMKVPQNSTSNSAYYEDLIKEPSSLNNFTHVTNSTICKTSNGSFASQTLNCNLFCNSNIDKYELPLNTKNSDYDINNIKSTHKCSSLSRCLGINQLEDLPLEEMDKFSLSFDSKKFKEIPSTIEGSIGNVEDLSNLNHAFTPPNHSIVCNSSNKFVEMESSSLNEANIWNNVDFERINQEHIEDTYEKHDLSSSTSSNRDSHDMDIDSKDTFNLDDSLIDSNRPLITPSSYDASVSSNLLKIDKICDNLDILQSSNDVLSSKGFHNSERILEVESGALKSFSRIDESNFGHANQKHQPIALQENSWIQRPCEEGNILINKYNLQRHNLITSQNNHEVEFGPTYPIEPFQKDSWIQEPSHKCQILIDELPPLIINNKKKTSTTKVTQSGIEIYEEPYDIRPLEDDIPYVIVEPLSTFSQISIEKSLHEKDKLNQSTKLCTVEMKNTIVECTNGEILNVGSTVNVEPLMEAQSKINVFALDTKLKKHTTKPLFFSGFLNRSSKSILTNSLGKNIVANGNGTSEENNHRELIEGGESFLNLRHTSTPIINGEEYNDQKLNFHITNNGNHGNGILEFNKKLKDDPSNIGRKNNIPIVI